MSPSLLAFVQIPTYLALLRRGRLVGSRPLRTAVSLAFRSALIVRLDGLGDLVLTTPLIREWKRNFPQCRLSMLVRAEHASLLEQNPYIDELITVPPRPRCASSAACRQASLRAAVTAFWIELRGRRFDVVLSPRWDIDEELATMLCLLVGAGLRVGYSHETSPAKGRVNRGFGRAFDVRLPAGPLQHEALRNLELLRALGGVVRENQTEIHLSPQDREYATNLLRNVSRDHSVIALGIGAQAKGRRWPFDSYAAAIAELHARIGVQPVILCAPGERDEAMTLEKMLPVPALVECGAQIRHTCAVLERADLFIGNDSGAAHLAAAMGCKTMVVCRHPMTADPSHPNSPVRFAPFAAQVQVLQPEHGLDDCSTRCRHTEPHCICAISPEQVADAAMQMLSAKREAAGREVEYAGF